MLCASISCMDVASDKCPVCGNIIKSGGTAATIDACAVGCGGDLTTSCGGVRSKRMLIYEKTPVVRPSVVTTGIGEWNFAGCFR